MDNYRPPKADVADPPRGPGSPFTAVVVGLLVDVGGTVLASALMGILYSAYLAAQGVQLDDIQDRLQEGFQQGWGFALATAVGSACSFLGGYVCARIARRRDSMPVLVLSALSVSVGLLLGPPGNYAVGETISLSALTVLCIFAGARLGMRRLASPAA